MLKYVIAAIGGFFVFVGGVDFHLNIPMSHGRYLVWIGIAMLCLKVPVLIAAGIKYLRQRLQRSRQDYMYLSLAIAIFSAMDACAETIHAGTLTPPDVTPMIQRSLVTGAAVWAWILPIVALVLFFWWLYIPVSQRGSGWRGRRR